MNQCNCSYQETLLAMFDIQAYSCYVREHTMNQVIDKTRTFINEACLLSASLGEFKLDTYVMSDTIILVINNSLVKIDLYKAKWFIASCIRLMTTSIQNNFVLRGAIGSGYFYKDNDIIVSSALVDAAKYEKAADWYGTVLSLDAIDLLQNIVINKSDNWYFEFDGLINYGKIPWKKAYIAKSDFPSEHYFIKTNINNPNWTSYIPDYFENNNNKIANSNVIYGESSEAN